MSAARNLMACCGGLIGRWLAPVPRHVRPALRHSCVCVIDLRRLLINRGAAAAALLNAAEKPSLAATSPRPTFSKGK